jgi:membrane peptidoglycan carboxypeptidase
MFGFLRTHKIFAVVSCFLLFWVIYVSFIAGQAYLQTPGIVSQIDSSGVCVLNLNDIDRDFLNALLAVEDPLFYSHNGIDFSTPGAGWTTITQAIVKIYFYSEFSPGFLKYRKVNQSIVAWVFNRRVDKNAQLRIFINSAYFGDHNGKEIIGFQDAARTYFQKEFSELNRDEYLSLVAMIVGPNEFNVASQPEKNKERVKRIKRMLNGECQAVDLSDVYYRKCAGQ